MIAAAYDELLVGLIIVLNDALVRVCCVLNRRYSVISSSSTYHSITSAGFVVFVSLTLFIAHFVVLTSSPWSQVRLSVLEGKKMHKIKVPITRRGRCMDDNG